MALVNPHYGVGKDPRLSPPNKWGPLLDKMGILGPLLLAAGAPSRDPGQFGRIMAGAPRAFNQADRSRRQDQLLELRTKEYEEERRRRQAQEEAAAGQRQSAEAFWKPQGQITDAGPIGGGPPGTSGPPLQMGQPGAWDAKAGPLSRQGPSSALLGGLTPQQRQAYQMMAQTDPIGAQQHLFKQMTAQGEQSQPRYTEMADGRKYWIDGPNAGDLLNEGVVPAQEKPPVGMRWTGSGGLESIPGYLEAEKQKRAAGATKIDIHTGDMTKATAGAVQKRLLGAGDTLSSLASIRDKYRPEFQQLGTRWDAFTTRWQEKLEIGDVSPEDQALLSDYSTYRADAGQLFALTLKDLSGVAVNPTEFKRAQAWLPNPGTGLIDGDSPTELRSKIDRFEEFSKRALMKYSYINQHGLTVDDIDVNDIPNIVNRRGNEIASELQGQGLKGDALKQAVKLRLADEFGLAAMK